MHIEHVVPPPWEFEPVAADGAPQQMSDEAWQRGAAPAAQVTTELAPTWGSEQSRHPEQLGPEPLSEPAPAWQPQPDADGVPSSDTSWQPPAAPQAPRFDEPDTGTQDASAPGGYEWDHWPGPASSPAAAPEEPQLFAPPGGMSPNHQPPDQQTVQSWTASPQVGDWLSEQQPDWSADVQRSRDEPPRQEQGGPWQQGWGEPQPVAHHYDLGQFQHQGQQYGPPTQQFQQPGQQQLAPPQAYQQPAMQPPAPGEAPQQPLPLTSDSLSPQALLRPRKSPPASGWRRAVFKVSGGLIDPGESSKETQRQQMIAQARTPVAGGHYRVAVLSLKGGVGKTTSTVGLGSMLASLRGDRVIAVDANPDRGTLSEKIRLETRSNVRDLLAAKGAITRYADVRQHTSQATSRLEVLASDPDPAVSEAFSEDDYRQIADVLEHYYSICITDCGTGLLHSAMSGVLGLADQIVLVSSASVDGARSASATLDWLDAHDYGELVRSGVVVMSAVRPQNKAVDLSRLEQHFGARCRTLVRVPFDPHLEEGAEFLLEHLDQQTRDAYLQLTASVAAGFQYRQPR